MTRATFLLSKDPTVDHGGDIALSRVVMRLAAEGHEVTALCLSRATGPSPDPAVRRVPKPPVRLASLAARSLVGRRSLAHVRFDTPELRAAIDETDADLFVAEHNYMAEPLLASNSATTPWALNTVNPESSVWAATRGLPGRLEARRIARDEVRTARAARSVATYDLEEADRYERAGARRVHWLDITLPAGRRSPVAASGPRLVFFGERNWPPNQEAFELLARWWPDIARGIPGAELVVGGRPAEGAPPLALPDGMTDIGFVDDLDGLLGSARALVVPVRTGGGVRVKLLDAASRGLPVVSTGAGLGSHAGVFGIPPLDDRAAFVERCRELMLDVDAAAAESARLYDLNAARWSDRLPHARVAEWLAP